MSSETPRTDAVKPTGAFHHWLPSDFAKLCRQLERELNQAREEAERLKSLIAKSSLIEVEATKVVTKSGHPVIVSDGTMLSHKDEKARMDQRTKDLQAHAATARKLAATEAQLAALKAEMERLRGAARDLVNELDEDGYVMNSSLHERIEALKTALKNL